MIVCKDESLLVYANNLAEKLKLNLAQKIDSKFDFALIVERQGLALQFLREPETKPLRINWDDKNFLKRLLQASSESRLLKRALKAGGSLKIVDATAGLGNDSLLLASLGHEVLAFERSSVLFELLKEALERLKYLAKLEPVLQKINFVGQDFTKRPKADFPHVDVVYLDPLFDEKKSGLPRKEMRFLSLITEDSQTDKQDLLARALELACSRVVVKRSIKAPPLAGVLPHHRIEGTTIRYDVYIVESKGARVSSS